MDALPVKLMQRLATTHSKNFSSTKAIIHQLQFQNRILSGYKCFSEMDEDERQISPTMTSLNLLIFISFDHLIVYIINRLVVSECSAFVFFVYYYLHSLSVQWIFFFWV